MAKVEAQLAIITKLFAQEIFYLSRNMGWNAVLHKNCTFEDVLISQAMDDAIL